MTPTIAVMKRELRGYFGTPVAYVFLVVFLFMAATMAFNSGLYESRDANLSPFFRYLPWLFAFFAPAIAMRMWADERRTGTIELLLTLPITVRQAVIGKFLAGWAFFGIALLLTFGMVLTVAMLGDPDSGPIFTGYFGAFLMAGAYLAIGAFFSAVTKNQVIALILGSLACVTILFCSYPSVLAAMQSMSLGFVASFLESMSFTTHYDAMQRGVIEFRNVFFMIAVTVGFLAACVVILDERKAA